MAFGQGFLRLLRASCATTDSNTIEIRKRSFIRHLKIYSKACDNIWTSLDLQASLHTVSHANSLYTCTN